MLARQLSAVGPKALRSYVVPNNFQGTFLP
jgi:hypothetical protein